MFSSNTYHIRARVSGVSCLLIGAVLFLGPITQFYPVSRAETRPPARKVDNEFLCQLRAVTTTLTARRLRTSVIDGLTKRI